MGSHIIEGEFQSDKYPTTPRGKVPLSMKDPMAQDLLWQYAQRRRFVDAEFAEYLEACLRASGFDPAAHVGCRSCTECSGQAHHFSTEIRDASGTMVCKHCGANAGECPACEDGIIVEEKRIACSNGCDLQACEACGEYFPLEALRYGVGDDFDDGGWFCDSCARSLAREGNDGVPPTEMP